MYKRLINLNLCAFQITDLRTISARHAERIMCIKLDRPNEIPQIFLEMFDDNALV